MATGTTTETVLLYGIVGEDFTDSQIVREIDSLSDVDEIEVRINSEGGSVVQGLAMYDAMLRARIRGQRVTTYNDGAALSMGAILFQAGTTRVMSDAALLMLHLPHSNAGGNAPELRQAAAVLDKVTSRLAGIVAERSKQSLSRVTAWLEQETWFDTREAMASGLADLRASEITASVRGRAAAENVLGKFAVPERYRIASRAPIEAIFAEIDSDVRFARRSSWRSSVKAAYERVVRAAERLTKAPGVTTDDLVRATAAIDEAAELKNVTVGWIK